MNKFKSNKVLVGSTTNSLAVSLKAKRTSIFKTGIQDDMSLESMGALSDNNTALSTRRHDNNKQQSNQ